MAKLTEQMKEMVKGQQVYVGTASKDGKPSVSLKGSSHVFDDDHIVFYEMSGGRTWENIQKNPQIALVAADRSKMQGFRFEGRVEEVVTSGPLYDEAKKFCDMMKIPVPPKAAILVHVEEIYDLGKGGRKVT